ATDCIRNIEVDLVVADFRSHPEEVPALAERQRVGEGGYGWGRTPIDGGGRPDDDPACRWCYANEGQSRILAGGRARNTDVGIVHRLVRRGVIANEGVARTHLVQQTRTKGVNLL